MGADTRTTKRKSRTSLSVVIVNQSREKGYHKTHRLIPTPPSYHSWQRIFVRTCTPALIWYERHVCSWSRILLMMRQWRTMLAFLSQCCCCCSYQTEPWYVMMITRDREWEEPNRLLITCPSWWWIPFWWRSVTHTEIKAVNEVVFWRISRRWCSSKKVVK
jgi:hypothetical protein